MNSLLTTFRYDGQPVSFVRKSGSIMVNATEMGKPFGENKQPSMWLRNQQTQEFLNELSKLRICSLADLVRVIKGGNSPGTWMHEDVAMEFARWLSPRFAIWCNDHIKELIRTGGTMIASENESSEDIMARALILAHQTISRKEQEAQRLAQTVTLQEKELKETAPIVKYATEVLSSKNVYVTDQIAKELGLTAVRLNRLLMKWKVLIHRNGQYVLSAAYLGNDYTGTRTFTFTHKDSTIGTSTYTVWTERGRRFLHAIYNEKTTASVKYSEAN